MCLHPFRTTWCRANPKPTLLLERIQQYFYDRPERPADADRYQRALRRTVDDFSLGVKIKPLHINDSIRNFKHPEKSPGLPYTREGLRRKDEVDPNRIKQYAHNLKYGIFKKCITPCSCASRTHVAKEEKVRLVWVYPAHMTYIEGMFAQPLICAYQNIRGPYGIWIQYRLGDLKAIMSKRPRNYHWLGTDFSSFDSSVPTWLIRDAFNILRSNIDFSSYQFWGKPTTDGTLQRLWCKIVEYFIHTPLRLYDGSTIMKHQGVPSGSFFTSLIDSICDDIVMNYLLDGEKIAAKFILGDDNLVAVRQGLSLKALAEECELVFGMKLNPDKSEYGEFVSFLGYKMSKEKIPLANYDKLMAQLCLPSKPDRDIGDVVTRVKALQLACFGLGCVRFWEETATWLKTLGPVAGAPVRKRTDVCRMLEALGLSDLPPMCEVTLMVQ